MTGFLKQIHRNVFIQKECLGTLFSMMSLFFIRNHNHVMLNQIKWMSKLKILLLVKKKTRLYYTTMYCFSYLLTLSLMRPEISILGKYASSNTICLSNLEWWYHSQSHFKDNLKGGIPKTLCAKALFL